MVSEGWGGGCEEMGRVGFLKAVYAESLVVRAASSSGRKSRLKPRLATA
jgi:hypothetical protein